MTDTTVCPNCAASIPSTASFCTSCGHNLAADAAPAPAPADPGPDPTRIDVPGLHDSTQVLPETPPPPAPPAPASDPAPAWSQPPAEAPAPAPWAPAAADAPPAPAWGQPASASAPPPAPAPAWQAPSGPAFGAAPAADPWGTPGSPAAASAYGMPQPSPAAPSGGGSPLGGLAAVIGGALALVGLFTAWIGADGSSATVKGWDLTSGDKLFKSNDPYLLLGIGIAVIAVGVALFLGKLKPLAKAAAIVAGLAVIGICIRDWTSIADVVKKNSLFDGVNVKAQFGFYLTIAGGVLAIVGGVLPAKKS